MNFTIEINTENDSFADENELPKLLRRVAERVANGESYGKIIDSNGNTVGKFANLPPK